jgi:hypothetical protein
MRSILHGHVKDRKKNADGVVCRLIATPGRSPETAFDPPSKVLRVGDPSTSGAGRVTSVAMFLHEVGREENSAAIVVRVRPSVAVRCEEVLGKVEAPIDFLLRLARRA